MNLITNQGIFLNVGSVIINYNEKVLNDSCTKLEDRIYSIHGSLRIYCNHWREYHSFYGNPEAIKELYLKIIQGFNSGINDIYLFVENDQLQKAYKKYCVHQKEDLQLDINKLNNFRPDEIAIKTKE